MNVLPDNITISKNSQVSRIIVLTSKQAAYLQPIISAFLTKNFIEQVNSLIVVSETKVCPSRDCFWFPVPGNCANPELHKGIIRKFYDAISKLKSQKTLNPIHSEKSRQRILQQFLWKSSVVNDTQKRTTEDVLLQFKHNFPVTASI